MNTDSLSLSLSLSLCVCVCFVVTYWLNKQCSTVGFFGSYSVIVPCKQSCCNHAQVQSFFDWKGAERLQCSPDPQLGFREGEEKGRNGSMGSGGEGKKGKREGEGPPQQKFDNSSSGNISSSKCSSGNGSGIVMVTVVIAGLLVLVVALVNWRQIFSLSRVVWPRFDGFVLVCLSAFYKLRICCILSTFAVFAVEFVYVPSYFIYLHSWSSACQCLEISFDVGVDNAR